MSSFRLSVNYCIRVFDHCRSVFRWLLYTFTESQNDDTRSVEIINKATLSKISALESELDQARSEITTLRSTSGSNSLKDKNEQLIDDLHRTQLRLKEMGIDGLIDTKFWIRKHI